MKFKIMGKKGDDVYDYDIETAEVKFNELLSANLVPFNMEDGKRELVKAFDSNLKELSWFPALRGG